MGAILVIILTVVLITIYHKLFTVIYTNPLPQMLREGVIAFIIAVAILYFLFPGLFH